MSWWRSLVQVAVMGAQVVGRAFSRALRQEMVASQQTVKRAKDPGTGQKQAATDALSGISLQEAKKILNIETVTRENVGKSYEHLFAANDRSKGGSFYLQSKVVRAKERLDKELELSDESPPPPPPTEKIEGS